MSWTRPLEDVFCPKCGEVGQLKEYRAREDDDNWYYRVDHYVSHKRVGGFHGKYDRCCYLGKSVHVELATHKVTIL